MGSGDSRPSFGKRWMWEVPLKAEVRTLEGPEVTRLRQKDHSTKCDTKKDRRDRKEKREEREREEKMERTKNLKKPSLRTPKGCGSPEKTG